MMNRTSTIHGSNCNCCCQEKKERRAKHHSEWTRNETLAIARVLNHKADNNQEAIARNAVGDLLEECEKGGCYTPIYEDIEHARKRHKANLDGDDGDFDEIMDGDGTRIQFVTSAGNFTIDYTVDAGASDQIQDPTSDTAVDVKLADGTIIGTTIAGNGTPDFVEMLGIWLEYYLVQYAAFGFPAPALPLTVFVKNAGSATGPGSMTITISNYLGSTSGLAGGYNDSGAGLGVSPGHELFHRIQYTYNPGGAAFLKYYKEGSARWAEDIVNETYNRYNVEIAAYFANTTESLFSDPHRYHTVTFWKYMTEQHGAVLTEPQRGVDAMIALWTNLVGAAVEADGFNAINTTITGLGGVSMQETYANFAVANYLKDLGNPYGVASYEYSEDEDPNVVSGATYASVAITSSTAINGLSTDYAGAFALSNWGIAYHEFTPDGTVQDLTITVTADAAFLNPFYRIIAINGTNATVYSGSGGMFSQQVIKDITDPAAALDKVMVIVGAYNTGGNYNITIGINDGVPSVMLVIDHSGSMAMQNKMTAAIDSANLFVDVAAANGVPGLGAVGFSDTASVLPGADLIQLDPGHKTDVQNAIAGLTPTLTTSIGAGLELARSSFGADPINATREVIVLLSDGMENHDPMIATVQGDIITDGIEVYSVGLGEDAGIEPAKLEDIALATDGDFRMTSDPAVLQEFYLQILATVLDGDMDASMDGDAAKDANHDGKEKAAINAAEGTERLTFVTEADRKWNIVMTWEQAIDESHRHNDMRIISPSGKEYTASALGAIAGNQFTHTGKYAFLTARFPLHGEHEGIWRVLPKRSRTFTQPVHFRSFLISGLNINVINADHYLYAGQPLNMEVHLDIKGTPLTSAEVTLVSDQPLLNVGNYLATPFTIGNKPGTGDPLSPKQEKLQGLLAREKSNPFVRETHTIKLKELTHQPGTYVNSTAMASVAGSYHFRLNVKGTTPAGDHLRRYRNFTKVARVAVEASASHVHVALIKPGSRSVQVTVRPTDAFGNLLGPGYASAIKTSTHGLQVNSAIVDHNDGTYSLPVTLTSDHPQLSLHIFNSSIAVLPATLLQPLNTPVPTPTPHPHPHPHPVPTPAPSNGWGIAGWLALVALLLALIAIILRLAE